MENERARQRHGQGQTEEDPGGKKNPWQRLRQRHTHKQRQGQRQRQRQWRIRKKRLGKEIERERLGQK